MNIKTIIIVSCGVFVAILLWFLGVSSSNYNDIQKQWQRYSQVDSEIIIDALTISTSLGYGGMIHAYKNYVIRGDDKYRILLEQQLQLLDEQISALQNKLPTPSEREILKDVINTLERYRQNIELIAQLHRQNINAEVIDEQVKVDDKKALDALDKLHERSIARAQVMRENTGVAMVSANSVHFKGIFLAIPIILLAISLLYATTKLRLSNVAIQKTSRLLDNLLDSAPDATIIVDQSGHVTTVNKTAREFFGYSQEEFIGISVDLLIPEKLRGHHQGHRDHYFKHPEPKKMGGKRDLEALTKDGRSVFVEISLNAANVDGEVFAITTIRDISERRATESKIAHQANYDMLTGLPNRFLAMDRLTQKLEEAKRSKLHVAVMFLDLDDFKKINDTLGHEAGDELLIELAVRLRAQLRGSDTIARLGGDEFIVILDKLAKLTDARYIANNILDACRAPFLLANRQLILTISIGIASYPQDGMTISEILRHADTAMYRSKEMGRNQYTFYTQEMNDKVSRRFAIEEQIHQALEREEFTVVYQPQIDRAKDQVTSVEALVRWFNPILGHVAPDEFIPVAEHAGQIGHIGNFVLEESLGFIKHLHGLGHTDMHVAVNLSPIQFRDPELVKDIGRVLQKTGVNSCHLELEITEGALLSGHSYVGQALLELKKMGVTIAMDDFGTGYSSLSYLRQYPFDILKIDKSFIRDIHEDKADRELVNASILMAHGLGLKVVAEGVETREQLEFLSEVGCDIIQGYFYSKPLPSDMLVAFLNNKNATIKPI